MRNIDAIFHDAKLNIDMNGEEIIYEQKGNLFYQNAIVTEPSQSETQVFEWRDEQYSRKFYLYTQPGQNRPTRTDTITYQVDECTQEIFMVVSIETGIKSCYQLLAVMDRVVAVGDNQYKGR